jgi:aryl carrier-like protein
VGGNTGFDKLNIYDDFYEIGGDSILATKIVNGLNKQLGVDVDVTELMEHPTVYEFAGYLDANFPCMAEKDNKHICKAGKSEQYTDRCFKLTPAQKRLFTLHKSSNVGMTYNIPSVMIIEGMLDKEKIENIFKTLIGRHEALRTSFEVREGVPYQKVNDDFEFTLEYSEYEAMGQDIEV